MKEVSIVGLDLAKRVFQGTHPRRAALLRSEANWMFCLYGRQYRQCENRGFNDREAAAS